MKNYVASWMAINLILAAITSPLPAQQASSKTPTRLNGPQILKVVFATLDENEDGLLQEQEAQGALREKLGRRWPINTKLADQWRALADADNSGELTWLETLTVSHYVLSQIDRRLYDELIQLPVAKQMLAGEYEEPTKRYCASASDTELRLQYRKAGLWQLTRAAFVELDKDKDGRLKADEIRRRKSIRAVAARIDKDNDESLSQPEVYDYLLDYQTQMLLQGGANAAAAITQMYKQMGCAARGHMDPNMPGRIYAFQVQSQAASNRVAIPIPGAPGC